MSSISPSAISLLSLSHYSCLYQALCKGTACVQPASALEEAGYKSKDLAAVLGLFGLGDGGRKKQEVVERMVGLCLPTPLPQVPHAPLHTAAATSVTDTTAQQHPLTQTAAAQQQPLPLQAADLMALGWFDSVTELAQDLEAQPICLVSPPPPQAAQAQAQQQQPHVQQPPPQQPQVQQQAQAQTQPQAQNQDQREQQLSQQEEQDLGGATLVSPSQGELSEDITQASEECLAAAGEEVQAAGEVQAGEEVQNGVGDDVRMQECSGEDAGGEEGSDAEQPDEHQPQAQQQTTTSVEWLARQTLAFQEKAGVTVVPDPVSTLIGRRVGFLLLTPFEHRDPRSGAVEDVIPAGMHQGVCKSMIGNTHFPDICEEGCDSVHNFCVVRVLTKLRDPSACIELRLDLSEHHRLAEISGVLALAGNEQALQDAWLLLKPRTLAIHEPSSSPEASPHKRSKTQLALQRGRGRGKKAAGRGRGK